MIADGEDELICDLAETYRILHYRTVALPLLATLAAGLREDSRICKKQSGVKTDTSTLLLGAALCSGFGAGSLPTPVMDALTGRAAPPNKVQSFASGAAFDAAWHKNNGEAN
jgi:hypothetical protein